MIKSKYGFVYKAEIKPVFVTGSKKMYKKGIVEMHYSDLFTFELELTIEFEKMQRYYIEKTLFAKANKFGKPTSRWHSVYCMEDLKLFKQCETNWPDDGRCCN